MPIRTPDGYLDITNATLRGSEIITTSKVGIANSAPTHTLSVGNKLFVDDSAANVLTVTGNLVATSLKIGQIDLAPSYALEHVANVGNTISNVVQFTNTGTGFVSASNVGIGTTTSPAGLFDVVGAFRMRYQDMGVTKAHIITGANSTSITESGGTYTYTRAGSSTTGNFLPNPSNIVPKVGQRYRVKLTARSDYAGTIRYECPTSTIITTYDLTATFKEYTWDFTATGTTMQFAVTTASGTTSQFNAFSIERLGVGFNVNPTSTTAPVQISGVTHFSDNVGIGVANPVVKLDVSGIGRFTNNGGSLQLVGTEHTYMEYYPDGVSAGRKAYLGYGGPTNDNFTIHNDAGSGHIILSGGNVGIGAANPTSALHVYKSGSAAFMTVESSGGAHMAQLQLKNPNGYFLLRCDGTSGDLLFLTGNQSGPVFKQNGTVGIGTASPSGAFEIQSSSAGQTAVMPPTTQLVLTCDDANAGDPGDLGAGLTFKQRWFNSNGTHVATGGIYGVKTVSNGSYGGGLAFFRGPSGGNNLTEAMRIDHDGNVGIGVASPAAKFDVRGASHDPSIPTVHIGDNAADAGDYGMVNLVRHATAGGSKAHLAFIRNGNTVTAMGFHNNTNTFGIWTSFGGVTTTPRLSIDSAGNVGIGTASATQGNLTVRGLGADPYFSGYSQNALADSSDFTGVAHFKSSGSHGVIRITNESDVTGTTRLDFNTRLSSLWGNNVSSNGRNRGTAPAAGRIMVTGEISNNYEDAYMSFWTCRDQRPDGQGHTGNLYERMRINSEGNVGIGTVGPNVRLHVNGGHIGFVYGNAIKIATSNGSFTTWATNNTGTHTLLEPNWSSNTGAGDVVKFYTPGSQDASVRMLLTSQGNVGINTETMIDTRNYGGIHIRDNRGISFAAGTHSNSRHWRLRTDDYSDHGSLQFGVSDNNYTCPDASDEAVMTMSRDRNVGIRTAYPYAVLHVSGNFNENISSSNRTYMRHSASTLTRDTGGWGGTCILGDGNIMSTSYILSHGGTINASDERIKKSIVDADDAECLETLRLLKPKKYQYKDVVKRGEEPVWGFIAQEVKETLPHATQLRQDVIPNIYELANVSSSNVITFTNFNTSNLESNATTLIRTMGVDGEQHDVHLAEVIDAHTIRVKEDLSDWTGSVDATGNIISEIVTTTVTPEEYEALEDKTGYVANITGYQNANVSISVEAYNALEDTTGYEQIIQDYTKTSTVYPGNQLFVYGQQVDDFVFLKKEAIWTVATAALQEVDRQLQAEKTKTTALETKLQTETAALETKLQAEKVKTTALETKLQEAEAKIVTLQAEKEAIRSDLSSLVLRVAALES